MRQRLKPQKVADLPKGKALFQVGTEAAAPLAAWFAAPAVVAVSR